MKYYYKSTDKYEILDLYKDNPYFESWFKIVKNILEDREFQKRRAFFHHEGECLWTHCIKVSFNSYIYAKKHKINEYNCAIGGLLHDFYKTAWYDSPELDQLEEKYKEKILNTKKVKLKEKHGIIHPQEALENSREFYPDYLNERIENAIVAHMFPLSLLANKELPKYKESHVVWWIDKKVSWTNLPSPKNSLKYVGLGKKKKNL